MIINFKQGFLRELLTALFCIFMPNFIITSPYLGKHYVLQKLYFFAAVYKALGTMYMEF